MRRSAYERIGGYAAIKGELISKMQQGLNDQFQPPVVPPPPPVARVAPFRLVRASARR